jgi:Ca2+-binding RTX toxin-like protein
LWQRAARRSSSTAATTRCSAGPARTTLWGETTVAAPFGLAVTLAGGNDALDGGTGDDTLAGSDGNDRIAGDGDAGSAFGSGHVIGGADRLLGGRATTPSPATATILSDGRGLPSTAGPTASTAEPGATSWSATAAPRR